MNDLLSKKGNKPLLLGAAALLALQLGFAGSAYAVAPPRSGEIEQFQQNGTLQERVDYAEALGGNKVAPDLVEDLNNKLHKLSGEPLQPPGGSEGGNFRSMSGLNFATPSGWVGSMPRTGTAKALVLLIDFPDAREDGSNPVADVQDSFFGTGNTANAPYESLKTFYKRSSYDKLTIDGKVLGWYTAKHNRDYYYRANAGAGAAPREELIQEALNYYKANGEDFTQYDSNNDGYIDGLYVKWTGAAGPWSSFWWAYQTGWSNGNVVIDGKKIKSYVWSWIANPNYDARHPGNKYYPQVDIHETGHMLGLPDYYDYKDGNSNKGGLGGLDMMDGNWGDHNAFSKFMLGWLQPKVVSKLGKSNIALKPSGTDGDAVLIMPNATGDEFGEFFMAQYRDNTKGNDTELPTSGMLIWHIDSTLNASQTDFLYNNSSSAHKLISLVEADGLNEINQKKRANAGDFYTTGKIFGPDTKPNSGNYKGKKTYVTIDKFNIGASIMSADFAIVGDSSLEIAVADASKSPVQDLYVTVKDLAGNDVTESMAGTGNAQKTDSTGKFKGSVNKGQYIVSVTDAAYSQTVSANVSVSGNTKTALSWLTSGKLDPKKQGVLGGVVLNASKQPANGATVKAISGKSIYSTTTDSRGYFKLIVPPGTYSLVIVGSDYSDTSTAARQYKNQLFKGIKVSPGQQYSPLGEMNNQDAWGSYDVLNDAVNASKASSGAITVFGTAATGATIVVSQVTLDGSNNVTSKTVIATAAVKAAKDGTTVSYTVSLPNTYSGSKIVVTATDEAGNWETSAVATLP